MRTFIAAGLGTPEAFEVNRNAQLRRGAGSAHLRAGRRNEGVPVGRAERAQALDRREELDKENPFQRGVSTQDDRNCRQDWLENRRDVSIVWAVPFL